MVLPFLNTNHYQKRRWNIEATNSITLSFQKRYVRKVDKSHCWHLVRSNMRPGSTSWTITEVCHSDVSSPISTIIRILSKVEDGQEPQISSCRHSNTIVHDTSERGCGRSWLGPGCHWRGIEYHTSGMHFFASVGISEPSHYELWLASAALLCTWANQAYNVDIPKANPSMVRS